MTLINGHSRILTMLLLLVQLSLPLSGPLYISNLLGSIEESHAGFVCTHAGSDAGHEPQDGHQRITHCYELDAPCDITAAIVLDYQPVISTITSSGKGALLPGYSAPIYIPPKNSV